MLTHPLSAPAGQAEPADTVAGAVAGAVEGGVAGGAPGVVEGGVEGGAPGGVAGRDRAIHSRAASASIRNVPV